MSNPTDVFQGLPGEPVPATGNRRATGRIRTPAQVKMRGVGRSRGADASSVTDNIGAGGFYVRLMRRHEPGERVAALITFAAAGEERPAARLAVRGRVLRVDELPGGGYGIAVRVMRYRFV